MDEFEQWWASANTRLTDLPKAQAKFIWDAAQNKQAAQGKDILSTPHPKHFGIPAEHWETAKHYAEYAMQNKQAEPVAWQPISTAPKDNKRALYLARFNEEGQLVELDFNGAWEYWQESWELAHINGYCWVSEKGIEEPTHWAYQDSELPTANYPAPAVAQEAVGDSSLRTDALCQLSYCNGLKAGWNFCVDDNEAGFQNAMKGVVEAVCALKESRSQEAQAVAVNKQMEVVLHWILEWDKERDYIMPYRLRDPMRAVLEAAEAAKGGV